jgi:hypothetical protein
VSKVSARKVPHKAGRPPGRTARPPIVLDSGDRLITKDQASAELGISRRTLTRMRVPTAVVGGVAYISERGLRKQIADSITVAPKRRARR